MAAALVIGAVQCLPILEGGKLVGVMTSGDLLVSWNRLRPVLQQAGVDHLTGLANRDQSYQHWIRRFILFHKKRHPSEMAEPDVNQFLSHLAVNEHVAASTQNQALAALLFLYQHVLAKPLGRIEGVVRAKRPKRLPVVLTADEMRHVLQHMEGVPHLICRLLYGSGLRLLECMRLRVKDIDFQKNEITVRDGKGQKDRVTMLPATCKQELLDHLKHVREQLAEDLKYDLGRAPLPFALARNYTSCGHVLRLCEGLEIQCQQ